MPSSLKLKTFENVGYNAMVKVLHLVFQGAANIILARNLASSDYGIAGFAMIFTNFAAQFSDVGMSTAALQPKDLPEKDLYTGFLIKAGFGFGIFALVFLCAPLAGFFFKDAVVNNVVRFLALNFAINVFAFIPATLLTRELDYKKLALPQATSVAVNAVIAVIMARGGYGYWSIVAANVCATFVYVAVLNFARPVRPRLAYSPASAAVFFRFGGTVLATGLLSFVITNADNFLVGALRGAGDLGYYALAFNWATIICVMMGAVVSSVLFPTFSRFQSDRPRLRTAFFEVFGYVAFAALLVNSGLLAVSGDFLRTVLGRGGDKWLPALATLRILCLYGVLRALLDPAMSVIMAIGRPGAILRAQVVVAGVELALIYPALRFYGIEGVAVTVIAAYLFEFVMLCPLLKAAVGITLTDCLRSVWPPLLAAAAAMAAVYSLAPYIAASFFGLAIKVLLFTAVYCLVHGLATGWRLAAEIRRLAVERLAA